MRGPVGQGPVAAPQGLGTDDQVSRYRPHQTLGMAGRIQITAGGAYIIEPGHDGWVVGDEPAVSIEFASAEEYAKA